MRSLGAAVVAVAVVAAGSAWTASGDDRAQAKGGGASSSSAGSSHHSSSSGSSSHSPSSSSSSSSGSNSSFSSSSTGAQQRHPRAGTGTGFRQHGRGGYVYYPYWGGYSGYYGYGYGFGYGWSPFYSSGYYGYGYQPYYAQRYGYSAAGSVRVLVEPNDTRVYVDGYYAGVADDFDGLFQRLRLSPGRHDIALKLDGYRSQTVKVYVPYDGTVKLHHTMVRGTGDDVSQDVVGRPEAYARYEPRERHQADDDEDDDAEYDNRDRDSDQNVERGVVRLDVRPADASVYVDGAFRGTGRELRQLRLTPGRHRLEVVRPGYRTIDRELDVQRGEATDLDIDLDKS